MIKGYKFEKSKYPIFKIAFWLFLICSLLMILIITKKSAYYFELEGFSKILKPITVNLELNRKMEDKFFVCFDDYCKALTANSVVGEKANLSFVYSSEFNNDDDNFYKTKIEKVYFAYPKNAKNIENKITGIDLYIGDEYRHFDFSDIKKMNSKEVSIVLDNSSKEQKYIIYEFDNSNNYTGIKNHILFMILSIFAYWKIYIVSYFSIFIATLIFLFNKDAFKISFKKKISIFLAFLIFLILLCLICFLILPKENNNEFGDYIKNDAEKYIKTHEIHILTTDKQNLKLNFENEKINYHFVDVSKGKLNKIEKNEYIKNNKNALIYFDSDTAETTMVQLINAKARIYKTNNNIIGKIFY